MNTIAGFMWQCSCSHIEYGEEAPEECTECGALESFVKVPEEIIDERLKDDFHEEEDESTLKKKAKNGRKKR